MLGVKFLDGPEILHGGERGLVLIECLYFAPDNKQGSPDYDKLIVGYQIRVVEAQHIVAVGKILRVWDET